MLHQTETEWNPTLLLWSIRDFDGMKLGFTRFCVYRASYWMWSLFGTLISGLQRRSTQPTALNTSESRIGLFSQDLRKFRRDGRFLLFKPPKSPLSGGLLNALRKSYSFGIFSHFLGRSRAQRASTGIYCDLVFILRGELNDPNPEQSHSVLRNYRGSLLFFCNPVRFPNRAIGVNLGIFRCIL